MTGTFFVGAEPQAMKHFLLFPPGGPDDLARPPQFPVEVVDELGPTPVRATEA